MQEPEKAGWCCSKCDRLLPSDQLKESRIHTSTSTPLEQKSIGQQTQKFSPSI